LNPHALRATDPKSVRPRPAQNGGYVPQTTPLRTARATNLSPVIISPCAVATKQEVSPCLTLTSGDERSDVIEQLGQVHGRTRLNCSPDAHMAVMGKSRYTGKVRRVIPTPK